MPQPNESASNPPVIVLLTDFGSADHYGGVLRGVITSICPDARFIDLSSEVEPYQSLEAGYILWASYRFFPKHSIFVCVVDPGVGSSRKILLARVKAWSFLVPDNGILDLLRAEEKIDECYEIQTQGSPFVFSPVSSTFHGRDVFAPVAGYLAQGVAPDEFGPPHKLPAVESPFVATTKKRGGFVLHCDRFGNIVTNIRNELFAAIKSLKIGTSTIANRIGFFGEGKKNTPSLIRGSSGLVEIVIREGSAARKLRVKSGKTVAIQWF